MAGMKVDYLVGNLVEKWVTAVAVNSVALSAHEKVEMKAIESEDGWVDS